MNKVFVIFQEYDGDREVAVAATLQAAKDWVADLVNEYEIGPITKQEGGEDWASLECGPDVSFFIEQKDLIGGIE